MSFRKIEDTFLELHLREQLLSRKYNLNFFWHRLRSYFVFSRIKKYSKNRTGKLKLLDIGAGAGILGEHLQEHQLNVAYNFNEPIPSLNEFLIKRFGQDSQEAGDSFSSYDIITCLDVLEHQEEDLAFLIDLYSRVNSNALLVLTVPAMQFLWSEWDSKLGHFRRYNKYKLKQLVKKAGFEVVEVRYLFNSLVFPGFIRKFQKSSNSEFPRIPSYLNYIIYFCLIFEFHFLRFFPIGSSLGIVCRKK